MRRVILVTVAVLFHFPLALAQATTTRIQPIATNASITASAFTTTAPIPSNSNTTVSGPLTGKNLPPNNKLIFGVWPDWTAGAVSGNDTAAKINKRLGYNIGSFSFSQGLPPKPGQGQGWLPTGEADIAGGLDENTNAAVFLTVYPQSLTGIQDSDISALAQQCATVTASGRPMFLRFAPEMNGDWFPYGAQTGTPQQFLDLWIRVYNAVNAVAPKVALVWSPNVQGPSGAYPYDPYWPGPQYVDWVGLSIYWKVYDNTNQVAPDSYVQGLVDGASTPSNFYATYSAGFNKPFVMSEGGSAINTQFTNDGVTFTPIDPGPGQAAIVMSYWNSYLFSPTFLTNHPNFRMAVSFEIYKQKEDSDKANNYISRDYRVSVDNSTRAAFVQALQSMDAQGRFQWAAAPGASTTTATATTATTVAVTTATGSTGSFGTGIASVVASQGTASTPPKTGAGRRVASYALWIGVALVLMG